MRARSHLLGVTRSERTENIFFKVEDKDRSRLELVQSSPYKLGYEVVDKNVIINQGEKVDNYSDFRLGKLRNGYYFLTYKDSAGGKQEIKSALSRNLTDWKPQGELKFTDGENGSLVSLYKWKGKYVFYYGEKAVYMATSSNLTSWEKNKQPLVYPRDGFFDSEEIAVLSVLNLKKALLLIYYKKDPLFLGACLFKKKKPKKILWRSDYPIWQGSNDLKPCGAHHYQNKLVLFFATESGEVKQYICPLDSILGKPTIRTTPIRKWELVMEKFEKNPIIAPIRDSPWESQATFNTAAFYDEDEVHFIYRAIGESNVSVLGYARSKDGTTVYKRYKKPIYTPSQPFEYSGEKPFPLSSPFTSGPGYGGCEDPRITKIGSKLYMTYVAFDGFSHPRVALTSIDASDFHAKRFSWRAPVLISPPGVVDKNAVILPEKINGKFVIFHRIYPNILIDFVNSLDFDGKTFLKGKYKIEPRKHFWDSRKIGAGPPPIKTDDGWLLIYHAVGDCDPGRYKIGAMILDYEDPRHVLYRTNRPIIEPDRWYENEGHKKGVAYPCGAVVLEDELIIYYGGADTVVCAASKNLQEFMELLKLHRPIKLEDALPQVRKTAIPW